MLVNGPKQQLVILPIVAATLAGDQLLDVPLTLVEKSKNKDCQVKSRIYQPVFTSKRISFQNSSKDTIKSRIILSQLKEIPLPVRLLLLGLATLPLVSF